MEHLLEHEMLSGGLRRSGPRTSSRLIPDSFRFARDSSEMACDVCLGDCSSFRNDSGLHASHHPP